MLFYCFDAAFLLLYYCFTMSCGAASAAAYGSMALGAARAVPVSCASVFVLLYE